MAQFILIIREDLSKYPRPKEELDAIVAAHMKWAADLTKRGIFKDSCPDANIFVKNGLEFIKQKAKAVR